MIFAGINYLAVLAAGVAAFFVGFAWYSALGKQWMAAIEKTEEQLMPDGKKMLVGPMVISIVCNLVLAFMLAGIMGHLGEHHMTLMGGLVTGFFVWVGFVMTTMIVNHTWQQMKRSLTVIDGGHWLVVLLAQGAIIGAMGV